MIFDASLPFGPSPEELAERRRERWGREMDDMDVERSSREGLRTAIIALLILMTLLFAGALLA